MRSPRPRAVRAPLGAVIALSLVALAALAALAAGPQPAAAAGGGTAAGCRAGVEADLDGSADTAVVSGRATVCRSTGGLLRRGAPRPYWTYEIACSPDRARAAEGLCSATPCEGGSYFAFRTLHRPDGRTEAAGSSCVRLDRAAATPSLTAADVFAAVRAVKLPGGAIRAAPSGRGLANVPVYLWLAGDALAPVNLPLAGSTVHAEFQPVAYRWTFGSGALGSRVVPAAPGRADRHGAAAAVFPSSGDFTVSVVVEWTAIASLDGRFVGQVGGLASTARISYPVVELRTALSG